MIPIPRAAVAFIRRKEDGKILCVWNRDFNGWSLPGGTVEEGETPKEALVRELLEETGLRALTWVMCFVGPHFAEGQKAKKGPFTQVHVFRVTAGGTPRGMEAGCPIAWLTHEELLRGGAFSEFYREMFELCDAHIAKKRGV